jgi:MFS family permease
MLIFLKGLGASATQLGLALALLPLTQALQILGARVLPRYGYRSLMVRGWTLRTVLVGMMAVCALLASWLGSTVTIWTTLFLLGGFAILRGYTSCAWMPWISQLVPEESRGRFLAWASALIQLTLIVCFFAYAAWLAAVPGTTGSAAIFTWACLMGFAAAAMMMRIPDAPVAKLLRFNILVFVATAALGVLWVPVLRDIHHQDDAMLAVLPVWAAVAQLAALPILGLLVDRTGSRPMLAMALAVWLAHALLWSALASGHLPLNWWTLAAIQATAGLGGAAFTLANQRLLMAIVPGQGRSHFFALHSVAFALGQGIAPVLWGAGLDASTGWHGSLLGWELNAHGVLYAASAVLLLAALLMTRRLEEPRALSTAEFLRELLVRTPRQALARLAELVERR